MNRRDQRTHEFFCYVRRSFVDVEDLGCIEEELIAQGEPHGQLTGEK